MLDTIRELAKQLKYQKAILDALVPVQDLHAIEQCLEWYHHEHSIMEISIEYSHI